MQENDLFDIFPEFSKVVHILAVIPAKSQFIQCVARQHLRSTMGQQRVSNIALFNTGRTYANSVVNNDMGRVIDIFGRGNRRDSYFF